MSHTTITNAFDAALASTTPRRMYYIRDRSKRAFLVPENAISPELADRAYKAEGRWVMVDLPRTEYCDKCGAELKGEKTID